MMIIEMRLKVNNLNLNGVCIGMRLRLLQIRTWSCNMWPLYDRPNYRRNLNRQIECQLDSAKKNKVCFRCGRVGHRQRSCPNLRRRAVPDGEAIKKSDQNSNLSAESLAFILRKDYLINASLGEI